MKRSTPHIALGVVLAVAGSMTQTARAQTSETWGGQGGGSSWQAGSVKTSSSSPASVAKGAESSWGAGKGSVAAHGSPGGVWNDGTSLHAAADQAPGAKTAAGVSSVVKPVGLTRLGTVSSQSRVAMTPSRGQAPGRPGELHSATGVKSAFGPQFGPGKTGGISRGVSRGRTGATARGGQFGATSHSGSTSSGQQFGSPLQSDPAMRGSTGGTPNSTLSLEPHSSLESSSH
jgi:hypothetical protein